MAYVNLQKMAYEAFSHIEKEEYKQAEAKLNYLLNVEPFNPILYYYLGCMWNSQKMYALAFCVATTNFAENCFCVIILFYKSKSFFLICQVFS